ncbi:1-acyldihydroxyacetone phosphate reductase [Schizosaccharomyces japonicus yFS275]|uniref:1-acyldihydroxyacetone phosphate reductase n=1 Tax=Schizosaccharomyces japonicus (strain yFS275 / FY16936) TaxID=402676 RepID=B6JXB0_SCHJY|nr:1-acyldihydroxyacetone phosphate reductase [Schizosaccharomyces japonicus yFS275]EEB06011.2 1-acyldihydroxyacetone phosphate reductase [Schizosaccharomyces japonicus yFS275]
MAGPVDERDVNSRRAGESVVDETRNTALLSSATDASATTTALDEASTTAATTARRSAAHTAPTSSPTEVDKRKTVLITGCSYGGIGNALARKFHREGFRVFASARRLETLDNLAKEGIEVFVLDVTSDGSVQAVLEKVSARTGGRLDMLINNAGQPCVGPALDIDIDRMKRVMEVNLFGVIRMNSAFQHLLLASQGTIVHINSIVAYVPYVFGSAYNATKAALLAYTNTLRLELSPFGVQVMSIMTGGVSSRITEQPTNSLSREQLPADSIYRPYIDDIINARKHTGRTSMTPEEYADQVFPQITGRGRWYQLFRPGLLPAQIWGGSYSSLAHLSSLLPIEIYTGYMRRKFQMPKDVMIGRGSE